MSYNMFIRIFFGTLLQLEVHIAITESSTIIYLKILIHFTEVRHIQCGDFPPHEMSHD